MSGDAPRPDAPADADVGAAMRLDDRLDDLRQARLWAQLDRALDEAPPVARPPWARRWAVVGAGGAALAAAAALAVWLLAGGGGGRGGGRADQARGGELQVLEVPAGASARAQLGPAAAVTLYGPSRLEVDDARARAGAVRDVDVTLGRGMLAGDYDHARGGRMRVRTPHAVVEIVGTVFAIEVTSATCVSVADGEVRVAARGAAAAAARSVGAGERWCVGAATSEPVPVEIDARMAAHAGRAIVATAPPAVAPPVTVAPPAVAVAPAVAVPAVADAPAPAPAAPRPMRTPAAIAPAVPPSIEPAPTPQVEAHPAASPAPRPDAELYATAEQAMRYDDTELADALLARLVVDHPDSDLVDEALFERARLAYGRGAWNAARASLDRLLAGGATPLRAPARFLLCRIAVRTGDRDAGRCLDDLRRDAPDARFALEALELRVQVAFDHGGCTAAAPYIVELGTAAPTRAATATWRRRCPPEVP